MALGYQNPFYLKQAQKKQQSLYDGKVLLEKHDPPVVHDSEETLQLVQESREKMKQLNKEIKPANYTKINHLLRTSVIGTSNLQTELERTKERFENYIIKKENEYAKLWNDWYKKCDECKYDKISYDKAYKDMQQKIERLQARLGDLKGKSKDTSCVSYTLNPLSQKLENENVELEFQALNYAIENAHLKATYKNLFNSISVSCTQTKTIIASLQNELQNTIYENAKLRAQLFNKAEAIATGCFTQNRFIIHCRFNKTPYELINGKKPDISFLYVFGAMCYPKNDREAIGKLAMAFEQRSSKPGLQSMTSRQISSGLDITYAPSTIITQQPTECELDLLFEAMYDDYIGGQPSATTRTVSPAQEPQVRQTSTASTTIADTAPTPTNLSSNTTNIPITSQDVDELNPNAMFDGNIFVNLFANPSTSAAESSSSQNDHPPFENPELQVQFQVVSILTNVEQLEPSQSEELMRMPCMHCG
nr:hypothetical protein [Tanacetum cinerariifolium]